MNDYYQKELDQIYKELNSSKKGLSSKEVRLRLSKYGENKLKTSKKINKFLLFLSQFKSFIVYILLIAVVFSFFLGEKIDSILILIILFANAIIGYFQELSAYQSLEALKKLNINKTKIYRDGVLIEIESSEVVPGDVIYLEAGDRVPADCRIIEEKKLKVNESNLTGENLPVSKTSITIKEKKVLGDQKNMLFSSTKIVEGSALAIVVKTGMNTEIGKITQLIKDEKEELTPLQKKLEIFGRKVGFVVILISIIVFISLLFTKEFTLNNFNSFLFISISLAVAAVPTALPVVVTISLAVGVKRLLKKKALVRRLSSVETLGSCNIICSDKTGTLTKNEMTVKFLWSLDGETKVSGIGYNPHGNLEGTKNSKIVEIGLFCNKASLIKKNNLWEIVGDPTEGALIVLAKKDGLSKEKFNYEILDEIPFDSNRKLMSVLIEDNNKSKFVYTKGAPNKLLEKSTHVLLNGKEVKLTKELKNKILEQNKIYSQKALRVLGFAYKKVNSNKEFNEEKLVFVGLSAMIDPPREDVKESIKKAKEAGIRVIMITGDFKETAIAIGKEVGIDGNAISGEELETLSDEDLEFRLFKENTNIFARVSPEDKLRIVKILQKKDNVVAMTGDGVNDAPALKKADIGIAVGSGTDVAKEAADLVLLDNSFSNIVDAIEEGRGIYDNIQKSIMLLLSGNLGEVLIIFLAVILGWNLPLTAVLLLWINLITDGAPAIAFSVDPYSQNIMKRGPTKLKEGILPKDKLFLIGYLGIIGTLIALFIFYLEGGALADENSLTHLIGQTLVFNFIVLYEILLIFIIRKEYNVKLLTNKLLYLAIFGSIFLQYVIMYSPLNQFFSIVPLDLYQYVYLIIGGISFILFYFILKIT
jgi:Ca2+-transporting ATPase